MVRVYKRKSTRAAYGENQMEKAINAVRHGSSTISKASKDYGIPYITLYSRLKGLRGVKSCSQGRPTVITLQEESKLAAHLRTLEKWGFALSQSELAEKVREYVMLNNIPNPFRNNKPGTDWLILFKKRHKLSVKKPQNLEFCRKKSTDPFVINKYFDLLEATLTSLDLLDKPESVYNLDETSLCSDPLKVKVVGAKGQPSCRVTAGSGKENFTILAGASAAGVKLPPLVIFKGSNVWSSWIPNESEANCKDMVFAASPNGWMTCEIFKNYFLNTLIPQVTQRPALIIYDGHVSHINIELINIARENNIHILKLPAHTSHLLQPLDLAVFRSFKATWDRKLTTWQRMHHGQRLPKCEFATLVGSTWAEVDSEIIRNGFKKGGIFPLNRNVISEEKYDIDALKRWKIEQSKEKENVNGNAIILDESAEQVKEPEESFQDRLLHSIKIKNPTQQSLRKNNSKPHAEVLTDLKQISPVSLLDADPCSSRNSPSTSQSNAASIDKATFESILLNSVKQSTRDNIKHRKKIARGADVVGLTTKPTQMGKSSRVVPSDSDSSDNEDEVSYKESDQSYTLESETDDELVIGKANLEIGTWVLVAYATKKTVRHFIGEITSRLNEREFEVKYTRKHRDKFIWPEAEDIDVVQIESIVTALPTPQTSRRGGFSFSIKFDGYNL